MFLGNNSDTNSASQTTGDESKSNSRCSGEQPKYRRTGLDLTIEWKESDDEKKEKKSKLTAERVQSIFKSIDDATCLVLGMDPTQSRPDWMIISVLPVPPMVLFISGRSVDLFHSNNPIYSSVFVRRSWSLAQLEVKTTLHSFWPIF